jgi:single-stranded DNA-binding protein
VTEVVANNVSFLGSKNTQSEASFEEAGNLVGNSNPIGTTDFTEDPFKDFGSEVILSDDDLPF